MNVYSIEQTCISFRTIQNLREGSTYGRLKHICSIAYTHKCNIFVESVDVHYVQLYLGHIIPINLISIIRIRYMVI